MAGGLIRYKGRLLIGKGTNLHEKLVEAIHSYLNGGHSGVHGTY